MERSFQTKKLFVLLNSAFEFIYLNLIWIVFSLPVFTSFPAAAAMFAVARKWVRGEEVSIFSSFKQYFKENFIRSFLSGFIWLAIASILLADFYFINRFSGTFQLAGLFLFGISSIMFALVSVNLLPVIVNFDTDTAGIWKNSFILAVSQPARSIAAFTVVGIAFWFVWKIPILVFAAGSISAYFCYAIIGRSFGKAE